MSETAGQPRNGIVLGRYRPVSGRPRRIDNRRLRRLPDPTSVQKVVNAKGEVLFDTSTQDNSGEQRIS